MDEGVRGRAAAASESTHSRIDRQSCKWPAARVMCRVDLVSSAPVAQVEPRTAQPGHESSAAAVSSSGCRRATGQRQVTLADQVVPTVAGFGKADECQRREVAQLFPAVSEQPFVGVLVHEYGTDVLHRAADHAIGLVSGP